ncbi:MAG: hypothetical protein R3C68_17185 [Myxococcota bacterium]
MDIEQDGVPEIIIHRMVRAMHAGEIKDLMDEVILLNVPPGEDRFVELSRLTVHEY